MCRLIKPRIRIINVSITILTLNIMILNAVLGFMKYIADAYIE